jgi:hypothetical protein
MSPWVRPPLPCCTGTVSRRRSLRFSSGLGCARTRWTSCTADHWQQGSPTARSSRWPPLGSSARSGSDWPVWVVVSVQLAPLVAAGAFIVVAYNLELFGGRFHSDIWFAAAWGAFPALTSYWANALTVSPAGVLVTAGCFALSIAQRRLSTRVRELRRRTVSVSGEQRLTDGHVVELTTAHLAAPLDAALATMSLAIVLLACAAVLARV